MEKSIESIWKEGFLDDNALVAPTVNNLYNQKSVHIIDKFKRMFRINLKAIMIGAILGLIGFALLKMPLTGIGLALVLFVINIVNKRLLKDLEQVDKCQNSYKYLKSFDDWMKHQISINANMAKWYYPAIFISMALGFWQSPHPSSIFKMIPEGIQLGYLLNGVPVFMVIPLIIISVVLWFFGDRIFYWDLNVVYGRVLKKLDQLLVDMEELRS